MSNVERVSGRKIDEGPCDTDFSLLEVSEPVGDDWTVEVGYPSETGEGLGSRSLVYFLRNFRSEASHDNRVRTLGS